MFGLFKKKENQDDVFRHELTKILSEFKLYQQTFNTYITEIKIINDVIDISLSIPKHGDEKELEAIYHQLQQRLYALGIIETNLNVSLSDKATTMSDPVHTHTPTPPTKTAPTQDTLIPHPRIRHTIVIASGKGGVGKSTTAVNIALALRQLGKRVGILDADIYGPSVPDMLGVAGVRPQVEHDQFVPIEACGLAMLSIGSLLDGDSTPVAWRGIKATGALMQLYNQTNWPNLDYLIIDMPPGTGDIQLTLAQRIAVTGAVIVTTPQHIALLDAKKGVEMFGKTGIPVIGIIENMALHTCSNCGHTEAIFGEGGADEMVTTYGVPLLGRLPLAGVIRENADKGRPSVVAQDEFSPYYVDIAKKIDESISQYAKVRDDGRIF